MRHLGTALAVALVTFTAGTASAQDPRATAPVAAGADTIKEPVLLSAEQVKNYLAAQTALYKYWNADDAHKALYAKAPGARTRYFRDVFTGTKRAANREMGLSSINMIDYPAVAKQDPAVAAIFTANHITPEQWLDTRVAVSQARGWVDVLERNDAPPAPPAGTSATGKNMTVVRALMEDIRAADKVWTM